MNEQEIKKQAKRIMDSFAKELEKFKGKIKEGKVERKQDRRKEQPENQEKQNNSEFRKIMLDNAPDTENSYIKSEKAKWEK